MCSYAGQEGCRLTAQGIRTSACWYKIEMVFTVCVSLLQLVLQLLFNCQYCCYCCSYYCSYRDLPICFHADSLRPLLSLVALLSGMVCPATGFQLGAAGAGASRCAWSRAGVTASARPAKGLGRGRMGLYPASQKHINCSALRHHDGRIVRGPGRHHLPVFRPSPRLATEAASPDAEGGD